KSRLGFSISVNVDPEILIIDEALSVGDKAFAEKGFAKMNEFKSDGKTMIFVSHSIAQMKRFCTKILWLEFGQVKEYGDMKKVIPKYEKFLTKWEKMTKNERSLYKNAAMNEKYNISKINVDNYFTPNPNYNKVIEKPVTKIAHFKGKASYLLNYPDEKEKVSTKNFKNAVYYVKKQARYQDVSYYLLSTKRSSIEGVIGWVQARNLTIRDHIFIDKPVTKIAHIKGKASYLLNYPDEKEKVSTKNFKNAVYYVKKQARYQDVSYYLLSTKRSSIEGVIGWVQARNLTIRDHIFVDNDIKQIIINKNGKAYSDSWGGHKKIVIDDLAQYKGKTYSVICTEYIGRVLWNQIETNEKNICVNSKNVNLVNM